MSKRTVFAAGLTVFALLVGSESIAAVRAARQTPPSWSATAGLGPAPQPPPESVTDNPAADPAPSPPPGVTPTPPPSVDPDPPPRPSAAPSATGSPAGAAGSPGGSPSAAPRPTVDPRLLQRLTGSSRVAVTFDDGPHPTWTPQILDQLRAAQVKAMFCLVGTEVRRHPALVARIVREGHTLCNHSWGHELDLGLRPETEIRANLLRTNKEIRRVVPGVPIGHFRHPGGAWTPTAVAVANDLGMVALDWDVDPRDWDKPTHDEIVDRIQTKSRPGSIVLLHDGGGDRSATVAACPAVLAELRQRYGITLLGASLSP
ncbi:polysaccharide deacetylase family protein [Solwaraspora sp. WMMD406]|uniref:polysaccharide deacetylase family protein n=1 Tax=Solwaraspora sp. WMMD406 TaxID=3016095 RepID=UPI00241663CF|nr:polysaccharide deacetylase family protein [Solwaraspora sp. WMMD406]MDG4763146.1 polysaccharide deacetylase family protein [Solwaraspora sp. WMMD406]